MEVIRLGRDALSKLVRQDIVPSCILYIAIVVPLGFALRGAGTNLLAAIAVLGGVALAIRFAVDIRAIKTGRKDVVINSEAFGLRGLSSLIPFSTVKTVVRRSSRLRRGDLFVITYDTKGSRGTVARELRLRPDDYETPDQLAELIEKRVSGQAKGA
jgi:hypothetical protein